MKALAPARDPSPAGARRRSASCSAYIIRRMIAAVILLLVVTVVTFGIFFLLPKLAGQTADQLAQQYVGKNPSPEDIAAVKQNLGLDQPIYEQYWNFLKGIVAGRDVRPRSHHDRTATRPASATPSRTELEVWPQLTGRLPVTLSLALGAAVLWLLGGVTTGVISALKPGSVFDRAAMGVALAGVSLPMFFTGMLALLLFVYNLEHASAATYVPFTENPVALGQQPVPAVGHARASSTPRIYARLTRAGMLETSTRTTSAPPGPRACASARWSSQARSALHADPDRHRLRHGRRRAARRCRHHRDRRSPCHGIGEYAVQAISDQRPAR